MKIPRIKKILYATDLSQNARYAFGYDLVVMGSRGLGMLANVMMGSTSRRVLRRCRKPVLVVRFRLEVEK